MDVVMLTKCARLAVERHGVGWTRLSFEKKHEIIQELESQLPKPAPVRVTIPEHGADGNSPGISGGVGLPLGDEAPSPPKTPGLERAAAEWMEQAHREVEGGDYRTRPGVGARRFDHPVR